MRTLSQMLAWLREEQQVRPGGNNISGNDPQPPRLPLPRLEVLGLPGHGKSSFVWASIYLLNKLGLVWPQYLCWAQEVGEEARIRAFQEQLRLGHRPPPTESCEPGADYQLALTAMERWGDRRWAVRDRRDPVFNLGEGIEESDRESEVNWTNPVVWLLSLPDLASSSGGAGTAMVDSLFDDLLRARDRIGFERHRLRVVLNLTKADRIADLPRGLREYLKQDPLAQLVGMKAELEEQKIGPDHPLVYFADGTAANPGPLRHYLRALHQIHDDLSAWLDRSFSGRLLLRRALAQHVELRLCLSSATGSDLWDGERLSLGWQPRRVLDATFWAFELTHSVARW